MHKSRASAKQEHFFIARLCILDILEWNSIFFSEISKKLVITVFLRVNKVKLKGVQPDFRPNFENLGLFNRWH